MTNDFTPIGDWKENGPGYFLWESPNRDGIRLFGNFFHMIAIATTAEDEQVAAHPENQDDLAALHTAGGTDSGYSEIEVDGHPAVVFLVPYDR